MRRGERQAERRTRSTPRRVPPHGDASDGSGVATREDELGPRPVAPGTRVLPTRSNPNRLFAAERGWAGFVGNTGSSGRLYSAETAETAGFTTGEQRT